MKRLGCFPTILIVLVGLPLLYNGWCWITSGYYKWHEKITIIVETPQGEVSAHSVQLAGTSQPSIGHITSADRRYVKGEAVVLKLPRSEQPNYLFALLQENGSIYSLYPDEIRGFKTHPSEFIGKGAQPLPINAYPMLVTFDDIKKPETVREVDPNDLAASFGAGYALKSITLEIVEEPTTQGAVERALGWYNGDIPKKNWRGMSKKQHRMLSTTKWKRDW